MMSGRSVLNGRREATSVTSSATDRRYRHDRARHTTDSGAGASRRRVVFGGGGGGGRVAQHVQSCDVRMTNDHWPPSIIIFRSSGRPTPRESGY